MLSPSMIDLIVLVKSSPVSERTIKSVAKKAIAAVNLRDIYLSIVLVGDRRMRKLNIQYRGENRATDVLSFPSADIVRRSKNKKPIFPVSLGDIVINCDAIKRHSCQFGHSAKDEFCILFSHSLSHLLGCTHKSNISRAKMVKSERKILGLLLGKKKAKSLIERNLGNGAE